MLPEIIYNPILLLSPHVFLPILFRHKAFRSQGLNANPDILNQFQVHPRGNEPPLALRPGLKDIYLFRRLAKSINGHKTSKEPIGYDMMSKWVQRISLLLDFKYNTISYPPLHGW